MALAVVLLLLPSPGVDRTLHVPWEHVAITSLPQSVAILPILWKFLQTSVEPKDLLPSMLKSGFEELGVYLQGTVAVPAPRPLYRLLRLEKRWQRGSLESKAANTRLQTSIRLP